MWIWYKLSFKHIDFWCNLVFSFKKLRLGYIAEYFSVRPITVFLHVCQIIWLTNCIFFCVPVSSFPYSYITWLRSYGLFVNTLLLILITLSATDMKEKQTYITMKMITGAVKRIVLLLMMNIRITKQIFIKSLYVRNMIIFSLQLGSLLWQ